MLRIVHTSRASLGTDTDLGMRSLEELEAAVVGSVVLC